MDRITSSLIREFANDFDYESLEPSTLFEYFSNYIILTKEFSSDVDLDSIWTGEGQDGSIDGIALIVNNQLITNQEELNEICENSRSISADIIFIQSKSSSNFDSGDISKFLLGIANFVNEESDIILNDTISIIREIWTDLIDNFSGKLDGNPKCKIYYITTGKWENDTNIKAVIKTGEDCIRKTGLFSDIITQLIDAEALRKLYRSTKNKLEETVSFSEKITLPEISDVQEAYYGILPFKEFKKLIYSESDQQVRNVFYDNVRDYEGENPVNTRIKETILEKRTDQFCILNNGITIIASDLSSVGNKLTIKDYQIVNGCQTSHVLISVIDESGIDETPIPVRLIVTDNESLRDKITLATNSQTAVTDEQLEAQSEFQKSLEQYYNSIPTERRLFYERRANQYNLKRDVKKTQIISIKDQIKVFSSMFLDSPHAVSGYFGTVMKRHGKNIFQEGHKFDSYYISAFTLYKFLFYIRTNQLPKNSRKLKYHILMIARMLSEDGKMPKLNSRKMDRYCARITSILESDKLLIQLFKISIQVFKDSGVDITSKQFKSEAETRTIKDFIGNHKHEYIEILASGTQVQSISAKSDSNL